MIAIDPALDLFPLTAGILAAVSCGLLGNFLVLRKESLMGDAISHSVLPGLVIAFLVSRTVNPYAMFAGAALAGVATAVFIELIKKFGRVEPGAAMGVVFSVMFALGVLLIEQAAARNVDLDADCVLYGQLELLYWFDAPATLGALVSSETLHAVPRQVWTLLVITLAVVVLITLFFKELRLAAFDPALATSLGFNANLLHYVLMIAVALATVAAFEAVGSILVIAMLVCPAASARLMTDRLLPQIWVSALIAFLSAILGYFGATALPALVGLGSVSAAGMITLAAGVLFTLATILAPRHGVLSKALRQRRLAQLVALEDLLADLYRTKKESRSRIPRRTTQPALRKRAAQRALAKGYAETRADELELTPAGEALAAKLIRRHRLWEDYLVREAGVAPDHVHETAEQLEHVDTEPRPGARIDPHGRPIPD